MRPLVRLWPSACTSTPVGNPHGDFHGLLVVQARIHLGAVRLVQIALREAAGAADALGDVVARQLEMHAAEIAALLLVDAERVLPVPAGCDRTDGSCSRN